MYCSFSKQQTFKQKIFLKLSFLLSIQFSKFSILSPASMQLSQVFFLLQWEDLAGISGG